MKIDTDIMQQQLQQEGDTDWERIYYNTGLNNQCKLNVTIIYICTSCDKSMTHKVL